MSFPSSPTNGQQTTVNGVLYQYDSTNNSWTRITTNINFVTAGFTGTTDSTNTTSGTIIVSGGAGVAGNVYANGIYTNGLYYAANGLPISFSAVPIDQYARNTANSASSNTVVLAGVDALQNTYITNALGLAAGAELLANTAYYNTIQIQSVDTWQNTQITDTNNYASGAYNKANTASSNTTYLSGVDAWQNNQITYVNTLAQSAFDRANTGVSNSTLTHSNTINGIPAVNTLLPGEPSVNLNDGRLYIQLNNGNVVDISTTPVGNTWYVSSNGNDDFVGNTPSAAKKTLAAAVACSVPGDDVVVSAGLYIENTPIVVPQNVSIRGSGERSCLIQPSDPTKDILWMNNNAFVTGVKFVNYTGSAVAFPDLIEKANAQSVSLNTITLASTASTSNNYYKDLQITIESGNGASLIYDTQKCSRDVGYMIDSISFDLLYGGNRQAIQSGVYYYSYNPTSNVIPGELTQVIEAYDYMKIIVQDVVLGLIVPSLQGVVSQNTSGTLGTTSEATTLANSLTYIQDIITNGPSVADSKIPISLTRSTEAHIINSASLVESNKTFIEEQVVAYINNNYPSFTYDQTKCKRDTGLIVDAIVQDMLFNTNSQSTFAGLQYWAQNNYTGNISSQLEITIGAINYVSNLAQKIVTNDTSGTRYQTLVRQITGSAGTSTESDRIKDDFSVITNIFNTGTTGVTDTIIPNSIYANTELAVANSYSLLQVNKSYLQAEAIAWVEANKTLNLANVVSYNGTTKVATLDKNWDILPSANSTYSVRVPLYNTPQLTKRYSTYITASPYVFTCSSITNDGTGLKVDGNLATGNKSIIAAQFTQVNTNGKGFHVLNDGYSQLVSIYAIFCDTAFLAETGGTASMGNCDVNFGNKGLVANGKGSLAMTATIADSNATQASFTANLNNIVANTAFVSANTPYVGLIMEITGDSPGTYYSVLSSTPLNSGNTTVTLLQSLANTITSGTVVNFYQQSQLRASGQTFEYVGSGTATSVIPRRGGVANSAAQIITIGEGAVFATATDEQGNFSVSDLTINQATSTISGRTFTKSLFAQMTPYILAIEG
jgi:hypothetical protein